MLAIAIPLAIVSFTSGHIIEKTGRFLEVLQTGLLVMTLGVGLLISLGTSPDLGTITTILIVIGIGFGPNFSAPLIALQINIEESGIATGTAAFGFVRTISGAIGVVIGQVVFQLLMAPHFREFIDSGIAEDIALGLTEGEAVSQGFVITAVTEVQRDVVRHGFMIALRGTWILYTIVGTMGLLVTFGIKRTKLHRESVTEHNKMTGAPSDEAMGINSRAHS
jgi:MFS family permease